MWSRPRPISLPSGILIHPTVSPQQAWAENWGLCPYGGGGAGHGLRIIRMQAKPAPVNFECGGCCAPFRGGAGSPSNTVWPGLWPTCKPSFILIHPTVWPQYTNITDRTDRQWSDRIGRTVLQTAAQKLKWWSFILSCSKKKMGSSLERRYTTTYVMVVAANHFSVGHLMTEAVRRLIGVDGHVKHIRCVIGCRE